MIERIFRVNKKRLPFLKITIEFSKKTQINIVYTVTALHNFIIYYYSNNEEDIYNENDSNNEWLENMNENKDKNNQTLSSDIV